MFEALPGARVLCTQSVETRCKLTIAVREFDGMGIQVMIHGDGVATFCCAMLLRNEGVALVTAQTSRAKLPAVLISEGTQVLLCEIFQDENLFVGLPKIRKRVVAWNGAQPETFSHSAMIVPAAVIRERLRAHLPPLSSDATEHTDWNIFTSSVSEELAPEVRFGSRVASVTEVILREFAEDHACWAESVESGWLFLIAIGNGKGSLICTGGEPASLLKTSRLVCSQIETLDSEVGVAEFPAYPRTLSKLHGTDWLACGTAAMFFDPLSGEGTGATVRESILTAATIRAILRGDAQDVVLAEFSLRMRLGLLRHLEMCRKFYEVTSKAPFWMKELVMLDDGISWVRKKIGEQPPPRYRLVDFDLVRLY